MEAPLLEARPKQRRAAPKVLARLVEEGRALVPQVARGYGGRGVSFDDLIGAGNVGVVEAAHRFDPERGVKFATYAVWWIRKELSIAVTQASVVPIPRFAIQRRRQLLSASGPEEIDALGLSRIEIRNALAAWASTAVSMETPLTEGGLTVEETLTGPEEDDPELQALAADLAQRIRGALAALAPRPRFVLTRRYGFGRGGRRSATLDELGLLLGLSGERVRQIENEALDQLRKALTPGRRSSS